MSQFDFCGYRDIYVEFSQLINFMPVKQRAYHMNLRITSHITVAHRRNKERAQEQKGANKEQNLGKKDQNAVY